jgi:CubicO group peptidase (beta-lactamase class C family)
MSIKNKRPASCIRILAFLAIWTFTQTALLGEQTIEGSIDQLLTPHDRTDAPGLAVGVIKEGEILYSKGWGMADLEHAIPISPDSVFDIASVSKQFAGLAIAMLESENKLTLDDPINKHVHGLPDVFDPVRSETFVTSHQRHS